MNIIKKYKNTRSEYDYELVAEGGFGKVYKSFNKIDENTYAIKKTLITKSSLKYALREVRILSRLNHENIVRYYNSWIEVDDLDNELDTCNDVIFFKKNICYFLHLQMEFCDYNLRNYLELRNEISVNHLKSIFSQILNGLDYIHSKNIVHRDIKPDNILITKSFVVKITDFGFGKMIKNDEEMTTYTGSALYASPEQEEGGETSYKSDIYSLGIVCFELMNLFSTQMERNIEINKLRRGESDTINLIQNMVSIIPDERPNIFQIRERLSTWLFCRDLSIKYTSIWTKDS